MWELGGRSACVRSSSFRAYLFNLLLFFATRLTQDDGLFVAEIEVLTSSRSPGCLALEEEVEVGWFQLPQNTVPGQGAGTSELHRPRSRLLPLVNSVVLDKPFDCSTSSSPRPVRWSHGNPFCGNS